MTRAAKPLSAVRVYPACCTSMYCGKSECGGCGNEPVLREFKAWQEATKAVKTDPIWNPTVWRATV